jgi:aromatic-L-amino-acid/L-tryptophan decarboxylase
MRDQVEDFRRHGRRAVDWICTYYERIREHRVVPACAPGEVTDALPAAAPEEPEALDRIVEDFERLIVPNVTHWNHPRFFSFFSISSTPVSVLAELYAAALNVQHMLWKSGPAATELEQVTLRWLGQWLGLSEGWFGEIFDTASVSTLHALAAARERVDPLAREQGMQPGLVAYCSEYAHSSVDKACIMLGLGLRNLRKISCDGEYRMRPEELAKAIAADRAAGRTPFCVVASVGTTGVTSVDPVREIAAIAKAEGLWLHVDGAYGGVVGMVPELRHYLEGVDEADSFVVNPHKWLLVTMDISVFYTRHPDVVKRAFSLVPSYLKYADNPRLVNLMDYGLPLGRRFRALKLWFVMRYYGRARMAAMIAEHCEWARRLAAMIAADDRFEVVAPVTMSLVCFRRRGADAENQRMVEAINDSGFAFLSQSTLEGRFIIRWTIGNFQTRWEDIADVWERVRGLA